MTSPIRYAAAACQTDFPNPLDRSEMRANTDRMLSMIDSAVAGSAPFLPVRLVVFPEFAHAAPVFATVEELLQKLAVPVPNEHTDRLHAKAREHDIYIQTGSMIEADPRWPGRAFNATCLIGPQGILYKYRKVNPWIPYEVHSSPHDIPGYEEPLFPVADTAIGRIGCAICYDWLFPEVLRQLAANGAEVLMRVSVTTCCRTCAPRRTRSTRRQDMAPARTLRRRSRTRRTTNASRPRSRGLRDERTPHRCSPG